MRPLKELHQPYIPPAISNLDPLWGFMGLVKQFDNIRPNWQGYMQHVVVGEHSSAAVVQMMPLIDMNPSSETCVYSTLL